MLSSFPCKLGHLPLSHNCYSGSDVYLVAQGITPDGNPVVPTTPVDLNNPLPSQSDFIGQITILGWSQVLVFFGACIGVLALQWVIRGFQK